MINSTSFNPHPLTRRLIQWLLLIAVVVVISACANRATILGIPPGIQIAQLELKDDHALLALRFRNGNDEVLTGGKLRFQLSIDGQLFSIYNDSPAIDIIAHSAEEIRVRIKPIRPQAIGELRAMASQRRPSVIWEMSGSLNLDQQPEQSFSYQGRLFPVPGRDDLFR